jgi:hypothetical protein
MDKNIAFANFMCDGKTQEELRQKAMVHTKALIELGVELKKVKIQGQWHAVRPNGHILKAPIPSVAVLDKFGSN